MTLDGSDGLIYEDGQMERCCLFSDWRAGRRAELCHRMNCIATWRALGDDGVAGLAGGGRFGRDGHFQLLFSGLIFVTWSKMG